MLAERSRRVAHRVVVCVLVGLVVAQSASAQASSSTVTLARDPASRPQVGVDAAGGTAVAWGDSDRDATRGIFASVRAAAGRFQAPRRLSSAYAVGSFAVAVGSGGEMAVAWRQFTVRQQTAVLIARGRTDRGFGAPSVLPPTPRGRIDSEPAAAIDAHGRLLLAWLRSSGRKGCGRVVMASVASRAGRVGAARRVSGPCPNAGLLQVAFARNGLGAVAWQSVRRADPESPRYTVQASVFARGRFGAPRSVSAGRVWYGQHALVAGGARALLVWRERVRRTRNRMVVGRVVAAAIDAHGIGRPFAVSRSDAIQGDVYAAMNATDAAIVSWMQRGPGGDAGGRAAVRSRGSAPFGAPQAISTCAGLTSQSGSGRGALDTAPRVALDASGSALAIFVDSCNPGPGVRAVRRTQAGTWLEPYALGTAGDRAEAQLVSVAASDAGEGVAAWLSLPGERSFEVGDVRISVLAP
ncbi:MAG: hypothetical protein QOJ63_1658 [Solirubrobacteraceae bacterium]|nr:hypothetical protein [Solirubrobacteraceae bacterium]